MLSQSWCLTPSQRQWPIYSVDSIYNGLLDNDNTRLLDAYDDLRRLDDHNNALRRLDLLHYSDILLCPERRHNHHHDLGTLPVRRWADYLHDISRRHHNAYRHRQYHDGNTNYDNNTRV